MVTKGSNPANSTRLSLRRLKLIFILLDSKGSCYSVNDSLHYLSGIYDGTRVKGVFTSSAYLLTFFSTFLGKEVNMPPGDKPQEHGSTLSIIWE